MKLLTAAAFAVLATAIAATPASAAHITFDVTYTSGLKCGGSCDPDPTFQPFSRRLTLKLTSISYFLDTVDFGPGGFVQAWSGMASFGPDRESPELLAEAGLAPGVATTPFHWYVAHQPLDGYDATNFYLDPNLATFTTVPDGYINAFYVQDIQLGEVPVAPSSPLDNNGFLDLLASLGPFSATEGGVYQTVIGNKLGGHAILYYGTATLDRDASAIPEPAAWALMLGGFGLAGAALRRRRAAAA